MKKEWIRIFLKGVKQQRAAAVKSFTREFQFTRRTMVKGIKFCPEKNVFKARIVYFEAKADKADDMMQCEGEIFVEEKWVRDEFTKRMFNIS